MTLKWTDTLDIAIELAETHTDVDPQYVRFTDLHAWVCALDDFDDDPNHSNEKILEAIQMAWIDRKMSNSRHHNCSKSNTFASFLRLFECSSI
jgi:FeS assembly protein IscX